ncbi:MAG TPA: HAMP domain-containing sensor histidine kinase [Bacteroidales bacterium]|nr:HAMP domain-containing sensor histidine kinase [Bacteroidales bacterium]HOK74551.1 HAMP domain-containing sensor histidine kinase [Bacteroidales bacterium]HOM41508.1 HAMP domain-containing sensor histidine kinase [Bacteroidales bacterium]HPP92695.1 HAMP domain-containing sensor histidine kinase [Bacteroidales bacterium]HRR16501.1 HAMP domain-containing sensor histidine kinase [Bacteroidales bacterium]
MKNKIFISLVVMMALSVIGIFYVQITWMRNAIRTSNENFNNAVFIGLNNAASEIESYHRMNFFNNYIFRDPFSFRDTVTGLSEFFSFNGFFSDNKGSVTINFNSRQASGSINPERINKTNDNARIASRQNQDSIYIITRGDRPGNVRIERKNDLTGAPGNSVIMTQSDFLQWLRKRTNEFQQLSDRMIREIFESETSYRPDPELIRKVLDQIFPYFGVNIPYEFSVIENGEPLIVSSKKVSKNEFLKSIYKVRLFEDNLLRPGLILSVVFPGRTNYVLGSISWMLIGSLLFSLFILATFALSIYFILRQKKISEIKSDFINNMTHEFKTPIATISLAADAITNPRVIKDENSIKHFASMIKKENERMNKQVETILQIASLDKKEIEFMFDNVSVHRIIQKAIDTVELFIQQKHGKINICLAAANDIIYGDEEHLTNLVHNLLDNAIKYSPEKPDITVVTKNVDGGIEISVADKGIGMSKSVQSKIFERFYRQSTGDVHNVKGFGLGLNYVKAIVDAHRGSIKVESEPGKGSCFYVFLPYKFEN